MHFTRTPYFIDYGEYRDFRYFQSDYFDLRELYNRCPQLFTNKWVIITALDYSDFLPPDESDIYYKSSEKPFKLTSPMDLPSSGCGDEYYFFDEKINTQSLKVLTDLQPFDNVRLSETNVNQFDKHWDLLNQVQASGYMFFGQFTTFIFKDKSSVQAFIESAYYKGVPKIHIAEYKAQIRALRNPPTIANEKCAKRGCKNNRIMYGVNCARHHYQMLKGNLFLGEIFDDPLPGEKRRSISDGNIPNSDKLILGITALLVISFIALTVCFILAINR